MARQFDAEFYACVHQVLEIRRPPVSDDRRHQGRRPYAKMQSLAPRVAGHLPEAGDFSLVCCHDLSESGFSFVSESPFECEEVVVALGQAPELIYMTAEVVRNQIVGDETSPLLYRVGCRFVERVEQTTWDVGSSRSG